MMTPASPVAAARACPRTTHGRHFHLFVPGGNRERGPLEALRERKALPAMGYDRSSSPGGRLNWKSSGDFSGAFGNPAPAIPGIPPAGRQEGDGCIVLSGMMGRTAESGDAG
jgi:hypothetical protein